MKTKRLLMLLGGAILLSATAHAQKVITEGSGADIKVIIDASGIPHTTQKKARTTRATNTAAVPAGSGLTDLGSSESNAKVYQRFEVSKVNHSEGTTWRQAIDYCTGLNYNGSSGWRLPTQRELMLIFILHNDLKALGNSVFTGFSISTYWCSTEHDTSNGYAVSWNSSGVGSGFKINSYGYRVRCIRDI